MRSCHDGRSFRRTLTISISNLCKFNLSVSWSFTDCRFFVKAEFHQDESKLSDPFDNENVHEARLKQHNTSWKPADQAG